MTLPRLVLRSLAHHWRTGVPVMLGALTGSAVLGGALLVGSSVRGSLRDLALERIGNVQLALESTRFFREPLAADVAGALDGATGVPAIILSAGVESADRGTRASDAQLVALPADGWSRIGPAPDDPQSWSEALADAGAAINAALARELGASVGDEVLVRLPAAADIHAETLMGRRDRATRGVRLRVRRILPDAGLGRFGLQPSQITPKNVYVDLSVVQRAIGRTGRVNAALFCAARPVSEARAADALRAAATLDDLGLRVVRRSVEGAPTTAGYLSVESPQFVIPRHVEEAVVRAVREVGATPQRVLSHLANAIRLRDGPPDRPRIPYSVVAAVERLPGPADGPDAAGPPAPPPDGIVLNRWAAERLGAQVGDVLELTYYMTNPGGGLRTDACTLRLSGVLPMSGPAIDPGFTPAYPGIDDARSMAEWDPPFPIDYALITSADEEYWDRYRTTPKGFIALQTGQALWADGADGADAGARFGRVTSVRLHAPPGVTLDELAARLEARLRAALAPADAGLRLRNARAEGLDAARGSTDFGGLFIGFSLFLIASAALLVLLLFRLGVEQRGPQIGLLLAIGFTRRAVGRIIVGEGLLLALAGGLAAAPAAVAYAWLMLAGLRTLWRPAVGTSALTLHVRPADVLIGSGCGVLIAALAVLTALRALRRRSPVTLLAGGTSPMEEAFPVPPYRRRRRGGAPLVAAAGLAGAAGAVVASFVLGPTARALMFFLAGALLLAASIALFACWVRGAAHVLVAAGRGALLRLALRNAGRRPDRATLTVALVACATFILVAVGANRPAARFDPSDRGAGHGGFALIAFAAVPLLADPGSPAGRAELGLADDDGRAGGAAIYALRRRPGDDASCLNLYRPRSPTLLGVPDRLIARGGFAFGPTLADDPATRRNPWLLLERDWGPDVIGVLADENTATWLLHLTPGEELVIRDDLDRPVRLRLVGTLRRSIFQSELLMSERQFLRRFPQTAGYGAFLVETPPDDAQTAARQLESVLSDYGFDATPTARRLADFLAVEDAYLSTFQLLGGLGLLLGTLGLAAVVARNVNERRGELALLAAVGFRGAARQRIILYEVGLLLCAAVALGALSALAAVLPNALRHAADVPWAGLAAVLAAVVFTGLAVGAAAARRAAHAAPMQVLRAE